MAMSAGRLAEGGSTGWYVELGRVEAVLRRDGPRVTGQETVWRLVLGLVTSR